MTPTQKIVFKTTAKEFISILFAIILLLTFVFSINNERNTDEVGVLAITISFSIVALIFFLFGIFRINSERSKWDIYEILEPNELRCYQKWEYQIERRTEKEFRAFISSNCKNEKEKKMILKIAKKVYDIY